MAIPKWVQSDKRIEWVEEYPHIMIHLKPGWQYDGMHTFGEDKWSDARQTMKSVKMCKMCEC